MSFAYVVQYRGRCEDPDAFVDYYVNRHVPIVWTFPKVRRIEVDREIDGEEFFMSARMTFDTLDDLRPIELAIGVVMCVTEFVSQEVAPHIRWHVIASNTDDDRIGGEN